MVTLKYDEDKCLLCPRCGAELSGSVTERHGNVGACYDPEGECLEFDTWTGDQIEAEMTSVYCANCSFILEGDAVHSWEAIAQDDE